MIKSVFLKTFLFLIGTLAAINSLAQDQSCSFVLKEAQKQYALGLVEKIPDLISGCLDQGFSRQERQDAYKLLILCYLSDNEQEKADSAMLAFLRRYPEYSLLSTDAREFSYLFQSYRTLPLLSIGLTGGFNTPSFLVTESNSINDLNNSKRSYERKSFGFQAGLKINTYLSQDFELEFDLLLAQTNFQTTDQFSFGTFETQKTVATETQNKIQLPVSLQYALFPLNKSLIYLRGGFVPSVTISTLLDPTRIYNNSSHNPVEGSSVDIQKMRNQYGLGILVGAGYKFRIPHGYIFGEIQYQQGISNQLNRSGLYSFPELRDRFYYLSDNFKLNELVLNFGYSYSFYKPTKKK
jgi:hypothetical protein